jgi:hypothetical protein
MEKPSTGLDVSHLFPELVSSLKDDIRRALRLVPKDSDLKDRHPSVPNRRKVRRRMLLKALHDVVFEKVLTEHTPNGQIDMSDEDWLEVSSAFSAARRDFAHDAERLDNGMKAELVLAPVEENAPQRPALVSANRKIILLTLIFVSDSGNRGVEGEILDEAVLLSGLNKGTLRTYVRELNTSLRAYRRKEPMNACKFSTAECEFYGSMYETFKTILGTTERGGVADLIAPIVRGLADAQIVPRRVV